MPPTLCFYCRENEGPAFKQRTLDKLERFGLRSPICIPCLNHKTDAVHREPSPVKLLLDETQLLSQTKRDIWKQEGLAGGKRMMIEVDNLYAQLPWVEFWLQQLTDRISFRDECDRRMVQDGLQRNIRQWNTLRSNLSATVKFLSKHISVAYKDARHQANLVIRQQWVRDRVFSRDGFQCVTCKSSERLCVDHIVPVSLGGGNGFTNLQTLCLSCNSRKGERH